MASDWHKEYSLIIQNQTKTSTLEDFMSLDFKYIYDSHKCRSGGLSSFVRYQQIINAW